MKAREENRQELNYTKPVAIREGWLTANKNNYTFNARLGLGSGLGSGLVHRSSLTRQIAPDSAIRQLFMSGLGQKIARKSLI